MYESHQSSSWSWFVYGGLWRNWVASQANATELEVAALSLFQPALGVGAKIEVGPNWYLKLNLGIDLMSVGLSLSF
jgi:hypothetical protein